MRIDYTKEYRELIDSFCANNKDKVQKACEAMGLNYDTYFEVMSQLTERFDLGGTCFENSTCFLKKEFQSP